MASSEERLRILKMIEQGKISATDGASLLRAIDQPTIPSIKAIKAVEGKKPRWLHVQITDSKTGKEKANINIPIGLVNVGLKMGARFAPQMNSEQYEKFITTLKQAGKITQQGKIYETIDEGGNAIVVFVE